MENLRASCRQAGSNVAVAFVVSNLGILSI